MVWFILLYCNLMEKKSKLACEFVALQAVHRFHIGEHKSLYCCQPSPKSGRKWWKKRIRFHNFCQVFPALWFCLVVNSFAYNYRPSEWMSYVWGMNLRRGVPREGHRKEGKATCDDMGRVVSKSPMKSWVYPSTLCKWCQAVGGRGAGTSLVTQGPIFPDIACSRHGTRKVKIMKQNLGTHPPASRITRAGKGMKTPLHRS